MNIQLDTKALIALCGVMILVLGVFLPSLSTPIFGNVSYLGLGTISGFGILALAAIALALTFTRRVRFAGMPGALALVVIGHDYVMLQSDISEANAEFTTRPEAAGLGDLASAFYVTPSYGWVVLGLGAVTLIAASWMRLRATVAA